MKKIAKISVAVVALAALSQVALAATPGSYAGVGLGYARQESADFSKDYTDKPNVSITSQNKGNVAGRAFGGYNINEYFGVEAGYNYLGKQKINVANSETKTKADISNQLQSADLVAKAYLPLSDTGVNLYALGGGAYVHSKVDVDGTGTHIDGSSTSNALRPKYGVGVSFDVPNSPISTALEVSRVQGLGSHSDIPNVDSAMLTVSYNFG